MHTGGVGEFTDTYEVIGEIGRGGGGSVYKAYHKRLRTEVVIKKIHGHVMDKVNWRTEIDILKKLRFSYLPQVYDYFEIQGEVYTVMEYIPGKSFQQLLKEGRIFKQRDILKWGSQLIEAVDYLHRQNPPIIHSDIKPANIMLTPAGDICLIDFNVSAVFDSNGAFALGYTEGYSPPEQYPRQQEKKILSKDLEATVLMDTKEPVKKKMTLKHQAIDARSDIYSIGATIYHLLTGVKPRGAFKGVIPLTEYNHLKISSGMIHIIEKAMNPNPHKRYASAGQLLKAWQDVGKLDKRYKNFILRQEITYIALLMTFFIFSLMTYFGKNRVSFERQQGYEEYIREMEVFRQEGDYLSLEEYFAKALILAPNELAAYYQKALSEYERGNYEDCISFIKNQVLVLKELSFSEDIEGIYFILGNCYLETEDYLNAVLYFEETLLLNPFNEAYYMDYAIALVRAGDVEAAAKALDEADRYGIASEAAMLVRGEIAYAMSDYETAIASFHECLEKTRDEELMLRAYIMSNKVYQSQQCNIEGRLEKNITLLERGMAELSSANTPAIIELLVQAYVDYGDEADDEEAYKKAILLLQDFIREGKAAFHTHNNLAVLYQQLGYFEAAREQLETMMDLYPDNYNVLKRLAFLEADIQSSIENYRRDYSRFENYYEQGIKLYESLPNTVDLEMDLLKQIYQDLRAGGWL